MQRPSGYFLLRFWDPETDAKLGACVVGPCEALEAIPLAHERGCNPGGAVLVSLFAARAAELIPDSYRDRLLTAADFEMLTRIVNVGWEGQPS